MVNEFLEDENNIGEDEVMDLDEGQVHLIGNEGIISADDDLQNLTDGELEENNDQLQEALGDLKEAVIPDEDTEGKDQAIGEMGKKKGARKGLFKSISVAGGSTKARMVQNLMATRK